MIRSAPRPMCKHCSSYRYWDLSLTRPGQAGVVADRGWPRDPRSAAAEAYRTLALNLQFSSLDQPLRTVAVTSPSAGEGKTTTVANLAAVLAESGRRVIAVDADLRRPGLHALFGLRNDAG